MANCGCSIKKPFVSVCVLEGGPPVPDSFDHKIRLSKYCLTAPPATARPTTAALTRTEPSTRLAAPRRDSHHSRTSLGYRSFSPLAPCDRTLDYRRATHNVIPTNKSCIGPLSHRGVAAFHAAVSLSSPR